jgi:hypothetical protein
MDRGSRNLLIGGLAILGALCTLPASAQVSNEDVHAAERAAFGFGTLRGGANGNDPNAPNAANTVEAYVGDYTVPPLFETPGQQTPEGWPARRAELAQMVEDVWTGRIPATVSGFTISWDKLSVEDQPVNYVQEHWTGRITTPDGRSGPVIDAIISFPREAQNVPSIISYTYVWPGGRPPSFGNNNAPDAVQQAIDQGWAHVAYQPQLLQADNGAEMERGVIGLARWPRQQHDWGALRAWGWGASQLREELGKDPRIAADRVTLTGHSRFGKGVLVAAAFDHEFHDAHVSSSGAGGASLMRRNFGELWENLTASGEFHWFTPNAMNFSRDQITVHDLPVDAHTLIALRAPRPLFITTGLAEKGESWVDPVGNWTGYMLAQPAWELFGASVPPPRMPVAESREQMPYPLAWYQHGEGHVPWPAFDEFYEHAERFYED